MSQTYIDLIKLDVLVSFFHFLCTDLHRLHLGRENRQKNVYLVAATIIGLVEKKTGQDKSVSCDLWTVEQNRIR